MDPITKYILEDEIADDPDKAIDQKFKDIKKMKKDTENSTKGLKNMPMPTESRIDKITNYLLENGCRQGKGYTWNSIKRKCVKNPPYDEEEDDEISGAFAAKRNATDPKKNEQDGVSLMLLDIYLENIQGNLTDNYEIKDSNIHGKGTHSKKHFEPGEFINCCVLAFQDKPPKFDITHFGKHLNHSYKPTAELRKEPPVYNTYAVQKIKPGDEVSVDYTATPEFKQPEDSWK